MIWRRGELEDRAENGHVIKLNDAWDRYICLAEKGVAVLT